MIKKEVIDFYAAISPQYWKKATPGKYLISAGSWWMAKSELLCVPQSELSGSGLEIVIDCGAWKFRDMLFLTGTYPYSFREYFKWAFSFDPKWIAIPDVIGDKQQTLDMFRRIVPDLDLHRYLKYRKRFVPVVQGKTVEEYLECAEVYKSEGFDFVAVGGIKGNDWVVKTIPPLLHKMGLKMHLFGAGVSEIDSCNRLDGVVSCDSGNWSGRFGNVLDDYKTIQKATGMTQTEVAINRFLPNYRQRIQDISWMKKAQLELGIEGV